MQYLKPHLYIERRTKNVFLVSVIVQVPSKRDIDAGGIKIEVNRREHHCLILLPLFHVQQQVHLAPREFVFQVEGDLDGEERDMLFDVKMISPHTRSGGEEGGTTGVGSKRPSRD